MEVVARVCGNRVSERLRNPGLDKAAAAPGAGVGRWAVPAAALSCWMEGHVLLVSLTPRPLTPHPG